VLWQLFPQLKVRLKAQFVLGLWPCKTGSKAFERPSGFGAVYALPQAVKRRAPWRRAGVYPVGETPIGSRWQILLDKGC